MKLIQILVLFTVLAVPVYAEVLFSDNFNDGNADGWTEIPCAGANYTVESGRYRLYGDGPGSENATGLTMNGDQGGVMSTPDYSIRFNAETLITEGFGAGVRFSWADTTGYGVMLMMPGFGNAVGILRTDPGGYVWLEQIPYTVQTGVEYWIRFEISGDMLGVKVWTGNVGDEPTNWLLTCQDATYSEAGSIALMTSGNVINTFFDDVEVSDDVTLGFDMTTWGMLKTGQIAP
jgi:hypothetical protein